MVEIPIFPQKIQACFSNTEHEVFGKELDNKEDKFWRLALLSFGSHLKFTLNRETDQVLMYHTFWKRSYENSRNRISIDFSKEIRAFINTTFHFIRMQKGGIYLFTDYVLFLQGKLIQKSKDPFIKNVKKGLLGLQGTDFVTQPEKIDKTIS